MKTQSISFGNRPATGVSIKAKDISGMLNTSLADAGITGYSCSVVPIFKPNYNGYKIAVLHDGQNTGPAIVVREKRGHELTQILKMEQKVKSAAMADSGARTLALA